MTKQRDGRKKREWSRVGAFTAGKKCKAINNNYRKNKAGLQGK